MYRAKNNFKPYEHQKARMCHVKWKTTWREIKRQEGTQYASTFHPHYCTLHCDTCKASDIARNESCFIYRQRCLLCLWQSPANVYLAPLYAVVTLVEKDNAPSTNIRGNPQGWLPYILASIPIIIYVQFMLQFEIS